MRLLKITLSFWYDPKWVSNLTTKDNWKKKEYWKQKMGSGKQFQYYILCFRIDTSLEGGLNE